MAREECDSAGGHPIKDLERSLVVNRSEIHALICVQTKSPLALPAPVHQFSVDYDLARLSSESIDALAAFLPAELLRAVPKRRVEYALGRYCAKKALESLDSRLDGRVKRLQDGLPEWPPGTVGSITHTRGFVSAAVAPSGHVRSIGIDSETALSLATAQRIADMVTGPNDHVTERCTLSRELALTLLFSAKESVAKCLYPLTGVMPSFPGIRVEVLTGDAFLARLEHDVNEEFRAGSSWSGRYTIDRVGVHTAVVMRAPRFGKSTSGEQPREKDRCVQ